MQSYQHTKVAWPISLQELIERRDQCAKLESKWSIKFLILFFGFLIANIPFVKWMEHSEMAPKWLSPVWLVVFFAILFGNLPLYYYTLRGRVRSFDLVCPNCSKELWAKLMPFAVATGHCCNCGAMLVKNHPFKTEQGAAANP